MPARSRSFPATTRRGTAHWPSASSRTWPSWSIPHAGSYSGSGFTSSYNVSTGSRTGICANDSTSAYNATITFASAGSPTYNLDLSGLTQTADGFVPTTVSRPATDLHGSPRPTGANDAGADER